MAALRTNTQLYIEWVKDVYVFQMVESISEYIKELKSSGYKECVVVIDSIQGPSDFPTLGYRPITGMTPLIYINKINRLIMDLHPGIDYKFVDGDCIYYWR